MAKTFRLSNLSIDEVSSVDKSAGEGTTVVLMKRDTTDDSQETDMNTDAISKAAKLDERALLDFAKSGSLDKPILYELINLRAQQQRQHGDSRQQAFVNFIERDPLGVDLYKIYREARGAVAKAGPHVTAADPSPPHRGDEADDPLTKLRALAEQFRQTPAGKSMTKEQAFAHVAATPEGRPLFAASNAANLRKQFALTG